MNNKLGSTGNMEIKMKKKIKSWGRKLANTFVRKGTSRTIYINTAGTDRWNTTSHPNFFNFDKVHKATVFVAFTNDGDLNIQVKRYLDDSGEMKWEQLLKVNLNTLAELELEEGE